MVVSLTRVLFGCAPLVLCWLFGVPALAWLAAVEARAALGSLCAEGGRADVDGDGDASGGISVLLLAPRGSAPSPEGKGRCDMRPADTHGRPAASKCLRMIEDSRSAESAS